MKKFTGYGLVTGACLFVSGALVFQSPHSSHAANGSAIAAVSGTAGTNIANSSTVSLSPRASIQPFQFSGSIDIDDGQNGGGETLDVPPGKELVIEYSSAEADLPQGQKFLDLTVQTTQGGNTVPHSFIPVFMGSPVPTCTGCGTIDIFVASSPTRLYSDSGAGSVRLEALRNATNLGGDVNFRLSGYLVDVQ